MRRITTLKTRSEFDLIILGNSDVGKSSLLKRLVNEKATELEPTVTTVGAEYTVKTFSLPRSYIKINICDTSGQERHLLRTYYSSCQAAVIVYDIQDRESYAAAKNWVTELRERVSSDMVIALAGNKADLKANRAVLKIEAAEYARINELIFMETSSVEALNVKHIFKAVALALNSQKNQRKKELNSEVDAETVKPKSRCCCCCCF